MKKFFKIIFSIILLLIIVFAAILFVSPKRIMVYFTPSIEEISDIQANVKKDTAYINTKLVAKNNSFLTINMDTLKYRIEFFNKVYFKEKQYLGLILKGREKDTFNFSFKIPYSDILTDMKNERKKGDSTNYSINLTLKYSTFMGNLEFPINKASKLKIPEPPELELIDIKYKEKLKSQHFLAEAKVKVTNNSKYNLEINNMDYTINIVQFANIKGKHAQKLNIKGNGETFIYLPIDIEVKKEGKTLMSIFKGNESYHYKLVLDATINSKDFRQEENTNIEVTKEGDMKLFN